ncbi:MAG: flagellar biosynthetic protein FliO [Magnetococcus sp. DMHC-6]
MAIAWAGEPTPEPFDFATKIVQIAGLLFIFIVLAAGLARYGKRIAPGFGAGGAIQLLDGRNLAPGVGVRLIQIGSRLLLIGVTKERVTLLTELHPNEIKPNLEPPT